MELIIYKPTEDQFIKEISFNFEDIRNELKIRLNKYQGLVYAESTIREAKVDRATLNKFKDALENKRKEVKRQCLAPYEEFELKIKELVSLVDQPITAIDDQVKAYEQQLKDDKQAKLEAHYLENIGELKSLLPFEKIFDKKWLNVTFSFASACVSISETISKVESDLKTIADLKSEFELQVKDAYLRTLDLSYALNEKTRLEGQKAKIEAYQKQQQASKPQKEEATVIKMEPEQKEIPRSEKYHQLDFRVWVTDEQAQALKAFLLENNIKFGKVA